MTSNSENAKVSDLGVSHPEVWYKSPAKLLFAFYIAISIGLLVPTIKSIIPIDEQYQSSEGATAGGDFSVFYIAGQLASAQNFAALYNSEAFQNERESIFTPLGGGKLYFNYPPPALFLWLPFADMSYTTAYSLWIGIFWIATGWVIYLYTKNIIVTAATLLSPALLWCVITGQIGFLVTILMGLGLYKLNKGEKLSAGLIFGLMIVKPHMAIALPIAMIATKEWRVIIGGLISSLSLSLISLLVFGPQAWIALGEQLSTNVTGHLMAEGSISDRIPTLFVTIMSLTDNVTLATIVHAVGAVISIGLTAYIWRHTCDPISRLITLFALPAMISPYFLDYDLTGIGLIFAISMAGLAKNMDNKTELAALVGMWVMSIFMISGHFNLFFTGPVFVISLLFYAFKRSKNEGFLHAI